MKHMLQLLAACHYTLFLLLLVMTGMLTFLISTQLSSMANSTTTKLSTWNYLLTSIRVVKTLLHSYASHYTIWSKAHWNGISAFARNLPNSDSTTWRQIGEFSYVAKIGTHLLILASHVDDCIVTGSSRELIKAFKDEIRSQFKITDLRPISPILYCSQISNVPHCG